MSTQGGVYVVGAGGHGKVVLATLQDAGLPIAGVLDDNPDLWGCPILGHTVLGPAARLAQTPTATAVLAIGDNGVRDRLAREFAHVQWATVIHPRAYVHPSARLGAGCVVVAGAVIQPDVMIDAHGIVNTGATVDHDCRLGAFVHVAPGANVAGGVTIGDGTLLGIGACVIPGVVIGTWAVIGAGAVVTGHIPTGVTAVGVPARVREARRE